VCTNLELQEYMDASAEHRDIHDTDVAAVIHQVQKWAESEMVWQPERRP
jgi:hypothetical protein